jgi:hypothetical protein
MDSVNYYTDNEAALIYLTLVFKYHLAAPSKELHRELNECPWLTEGDFAVTKRHGPGSIELRWTDFRTAVDPDLKPTRGASLPQIRRIVENWEWLTHLSFREDLISQTNAA